MKIYFEDAHLIVISKPRGMLSQGEHTESPNVVDWLRARLGRPYVGLVHRLDRNTSGLMVIAKRTKAAKRLTEALKSGKMRRKYLAWLEGHMTTAQARWQHFLLKDEIANKMKVVTASCPGAKTATLLARPIGYGKWNNIELTLVEFDLETGRSHQIRVQAADKGYPVLGDTKYCKKNLAAGNTFEPHKAMALHSSYLEFPHPISGDMMQFKDELPPDMAEIPVY